jgi:hypothetical protein
MKVVDAFLDPILKDALEKRRTTVEFDKTELADDQTLVDHLINLTSGELPCYPAFLLLKYHFQTLKLSRTRR